MKKRFLVAYAPRNDDCKVTQYTYDDAGNLLTCNDGTTSATYTYDNLYRKTAETTNCGTSSLTTNYSYGYNKIIQNVR